MNYRPVSNLTFKSKIVKKLVYGQLVWYLQSKNLMPCFQSAYIPLQKRRSYKSSQISSVDGGSVTSTWSLWIQVLPTTLWIIPSSWIGCGSYLVSPVVVCSNESECTLRAAPSKCYIWVGYHPSVDWISMFRRVWFPGLSFSCCTLPSVQKHQQKRAGNTLIKLIRSWHVGASQCTGPRIINAVRGVQQGDRRLDAGKQTQDEHWQNLADLDQNLPEAVKGRHQWDQPACGNKWWTGLYCARRLAWFWENGNLIQSRLICVNVYTFSPSNKESSINSGYCSTSVCMVWLHHTCPACSHQSVRIGTAAAFDQLLVAT